MEAGNHSRVTGRRRTAFAVDLGKRGRLTFVTQFLAMVLVAVPALAAPRKRDEAKRPKSEITAVEPNAVIWRNPVHIASRNLFYGPGGKGHVPPATFVFEKEDMKGSNPKFVVRDSSGVRWKIKLGPEARPETAASRLVWAVGYFANEDYFLPQVHVRGLPHHLHRGQKYVQPDGLVLGVRLKRYLRGEKKIGYWSWRTNPFSGTRALRGLRVMMALINNWDLKDDNTSIYRVRSAEGTSVSLHIYMVSDLGSSFGTTGQSWTDWKSKGNLNSYRHSKFVKKITPEYVDFNVPTRPALDYLFALPEFITDLRSRWIGRHIPRVDARWIGGLLARLSPRQIRDAFSAAGYSPAEAQGFTEVVEQRIRALDAM
jgi:hypothetical protein